MLYYGHYLGCLSFFVLPSLLTLINSTFQAYFQSLKKDLGSAGFDPTLLVVSISWANLVFVAALVLTGRFHMPTDPSFYGFWFLLTLLATTSYIFFVHGLSRSRFVAGNSFSHLGFVMTALYAILILHEHITKTQGIALALGALGALSFFEWKTITRETLLHNKGLLLIIFSLFFHPLTLIFYKLAIAHTSSYFQFLTGRFVMDLVYDSFFFIVVVYFVRRMPVASEIRRFFFSWTGLLFALGVACTNTLDSWLIYSLPVSTFTLLGTIGIPVGYFIAKIKYHERIAPRYIMGGIFILLGVTLFLK